MSIREESRRVDVLLIGAGIMSATLGTFLKELDPRYRSPWSKPSLTAPWKARKAGTTRERAMPPTVN